MQGVPSTLTFKKFREIFSHLNFLGTSILSSALAKLVCFYISRDRERNILFYKMYKNIFFTSHAIFTYTEFLYF